MGYDWTEFATWLMSFNITINVPWTVIPDNRVAEMNFVMPIILVGMTSSYLTNRDLCLPNQKVQIKGLDTAIPTERRRMH